MSKQTTALTPIQRIKRLREHYPGMRLMQAKRIVDEGEDAAMIAEKDAGLRVRAAAPDLLEAAERVIALDNRVAAEELLEPGAWDSAMESLVSAVAKARGAS